MLPASMASPLFLCIFALYSVAGVSSFSPICPNQTYLFLNNLQSKCHPTMSSNSPIEVSGNFLDRALTSKQKGSYTAVLFYASRCPFSQIVYSKYEVLSSMFPQIEHFAIEESSAMPSIFSRNGIHSLPSIILVSSTSRWRYRGPKDLPSLTQFYKKTTGLEPVQYYAEEFEISLSSNKHDIEPSLCGSSLKTLLTREPYLVFSMVFLCLKLFWSIYPRVLSQLKAFWVLYIPHFNMDIFGEITHILGHVSQMIDVKRIRPKLRLCKTRNFHVGARNARRFWAIFEWIFMSAVVIVVVMRWKLPLASELGTKGLIEIWVIPSCMCCSTLFCL